MYTPYLLGGYASALLLLFLGLRVIRGSAPELRGARYITRFILCALLVLGILAIHGLVPRSIDVVAANALSFVSAMFIYLAACDVQQSRPRLLPIQIGLALLSVPGLVWFTAAQPSIAIRLFIHTLVVAAILAMAALAVRRPVDPALRSPQRAALALMCTVSAYQLFWGAMALLHPPARVLDHLDVLQTGLSYMALVLNCTNVAALVWYSLCVHRRELHTIAHTDSLTGLLNRRAFEDILRRELPRCGNTGRCLGGMLLDIDHFKQINDSMGHRAGDEVLRRVADTLREVTRISDVLARFGGEEFVILLRDAGLGESEAIAERVRSSLAALKDLPGDVRLTVSIGVATNMPGETMDEFLLRCDEAMYSAKRGGRNLVIVHRSAARKTAMLT